jgi:hypothetical protein
MSQVIFPDIVPSTTSGNQLATLLNEFKDAVVSGFTGTTRPANLQAGGYWVDTTNDPTTWAYKIFDGTQDITIFTVNLTTGTASIASADSLFEVAKVSADSVGPIIRLLKERIAGNGQTLDGDTVGEIQFYGTRDTGANAAQARIRTISTDDVTASAAGSYMIFELAPDASASLVEVMRIVNQRVGVGIQTPTEAIHLSGNVKAETQVDTTVGPEAILRKRRVSGSGQVLSGDFLGKVSFNSTKDDGAEIAGAVIEVTAAENHTTANQGTRMSFKFKRLTQNSFTEEMFISDSGVNINRLNVTNLVATNAELGTVVEVADAKFILNNGGTQALANAAPAGFEVEMSDATHAALAYDSTLASKFKIGNVGSLREVVTVSDTQGLTNKTVTGGSIVTPTRLDVKQDTEANLTTYATTATNGQLCFATDTKVMYQVIDTALVPVGAGGGGVSLNWKAGTSAPVDDFVDGLDLKAFDNTSSQEIFATLTVPQSYRTGKPITLKGAQYFCLSTTGNVFFKTVSTLINNSSVLGTYPNQHTSTNTQTTVPGVANTISSVGDLQITNASGLINGVAVQPGNKIRIRLLRDNAAESSPAANDARLLIDGVEPTFS